ncbi:MAG: beta-galactosidase trimerization domain-containing protein, partial [Terriglobia bacterium]
PWLFDGFDRRDFGVAFAYYVDLLASAAGAKPWWVTELQGGPTLYTGHRSMNPTTGELTRWLWDVFGAGGRGVVFWLWNPRVLGREGGEWQMVSLNGVPSDRVTAARRVLEALKRMPLLAEATPLPPKTAILYNRETMLLIEIDGQTQNRSNEALWSLIGCYEALRRKHVPVTFIDLQQLKSGEASHYDLLFIPYSYAIDDHAVAALREFVRNGGTLWADGLTAWKNEYGVIRPSLPGGLRDAFGWESYVADIEPVEKPYSVTSSHEIGGELWDITLRLRGADVLLKDPNGRPFATQHTFGKGKTIYYGAAVALSYYHRGNPVVRDWIAAYAAQSNPGSLVHVLKASEQVGFRVLHHPSGPFVILTNWGENDAVMIRFREEYTSVTDLLANAPVKLSRHEGSTLAELTLPAGEVCVLKATK